MLQNRVDPFGNLIKTSARGAFMGNRGLLHGDHQNILRLFRLKAWITCLLEFKGWHRKVMMPNKYTELFFFDEATAFAAGHRPCAECRRQDFYLFKSAWLKGNSEYGFNEKTSIRDIDNIIHAERINISGEKILYEADVQEIPDGTFVLYGDKPCLLLNQSLFAWSAFGYEQEIQLPATKTLWVLTPRSIVNTFRAGYSADYIMRP